jgi:TonB family protein
MRQRGLALHGLAAIALALACASASTSGSRAAESPGAASSAPSATLRAPFQSEAELTRYFARRTAELQARQRAARAAQSPPIQPPTSLGVSQVPDGEVAAVTATRLPQANLTTVSPVTSISSEDISNTGTTSIQDIVNQLPQAYAAQSATVSGPEGTNITNVQEAGVDEGDIVKLRGDVLVILRRGRLFTVSIAGGALKPVASIDAYPPGVSARADWYDEMLIAGNRVIVIGYSYGRGGTEINRFRIGDDGTLAFEDAYHLRSNDYYSSRNYASRRIGRRLILYSPLYFTIWAKDPLASFPALRRWTGDPKAPFRRIGGARQVYFSARLTDEKFDAIHTVTSCDLTAAVLDCTATSVLGAAGRTFYVSPRAVYIWVTPWTWRSDNRRNPQSSMLYRLPLDGGAPSAIGTSGSPVDQFSFREDPGDGVVNVVVRSDGEGDAMWAPERTRGSVALLRVPLASFGDGSRDAPIGLYRNLPWDRETYDFQNRFVGDYLLYGAGGWWGNWWGHPQNVKPRLVVVPVRGGLVTDLRLAHGVDRIEVMGRDAVVVGNDQRNLYFSAVELGGGQPGLGDRFVLPGASQSETRSHGFFYKRESADGDDGVIGIAIAKPARAAYRHLFETSAGILFLRRSEQRFARAGELAAHPRIADDNCLASCVDWYGNARPIFLGDRTFALLGYELVEGRLASRSIREVARVDFAPPPAPPKPPGAAPLQASTSGVQAEEPKPEFARADSQWQQDTDNKCWVWVPEAWKAHRPSWSGSCENGRASGSGTLTFVWGLHGKIVARGVFRDGRIVRGTVKYENGDEIIGEFKDGLLTGKGTIVHADGARDSGMFKDGKLNGDGVRTWPQGVRYEGRFVDSRPEGPGAFAWAKGDRFTGTFVGGVEEGRGTIVYANGTRLEANFHNGGIVGPAVLRRRKGAVVQGEVVPPRARSTDVLSSKTYPPVSLRLAEEGRVVVAFRVAADGTVDHAYVLSSSGKGRLDAAVLASVTKTRWLPATIGGVPIAMKSTLAVTFSLTQPAPSPPAK